MTREISAGGVVLRQISGTWHVALIEPQKNEPQKDQPSAEIAKPAKTSRKRKAVLTLPKGLVDPVKSRGKLRCGKYSKKPGS
jgi:hypothetical protein